METKQKPTVNLSNHDGNSFAIIGTCHRTLKRAGYSRNEIDTFTKEVTAGDYDHVLQTVFRWFDVT